MRRTIRDYDKERCMNCEYGVMTYSKVYGGFVVGCKSDHPNRKAEFGSSCFVQKQKKINGV